MALFNKNKKNNKIQPPTYPSSSEPQFPTYESSMPTTSDSIKQAVSSPYEEEEYDMPSVQKTVLPEEKAIYVQIDKYKQAIDTLEVIKEKLKTAQSILDELNELKKQEDSELEEWQQNVSEIKERLAEVDNTLFEI